VRKPIAKATAMTTASEIIVATSVVTTWAHRRPERATGIDWKRSKMPSCMSVNRRKAV
jgi:hypothetical protein